MVRDLEERPDPDHRVRFNDLLGGVRASCDAWQIQISVNGDPVFRLDSDGYCMTRGGVSDIPAARAALERATKFYYAEDGPITYLDWPEDRATLHRGERIVSSTAS